MDTFGTIVTSIDLVLKLKAAFQQVGQNRSGSVELCGDIVEFLSRIQDYLKESSPSDTLRDELSEFENDLRKIFLRQKSLIKHTSDGPFSKLSELYNADDIKNDIADLRQRVQMCVQKLQLSCTVRIDNGVTSMNEQIIALRKDQEAADRKLQMLLDALIPGSTPSRRAVLDRIEENLQDRISVIDTDGALERDLHKLQSLNRSQATLRAKSIKSFLGSLSASVIEMNYLKVKIRELSGVLPSPCDHPSMKKIGIWLNPFRGLADWEGHLLSNGSREDLTRETLRILMVLRSGKEISPKDAVRDLLRLARTLGILGMEEEGRGIYDWGVQICQELTNTGHTWILLDLARFLHQLFIDLNGGGSSTAQRILEQAVEVRRRLQSIGQWNHLYRLAFFLQKRSLKEQSLGRMGTAVNTMQEVVEIRRYFVTLDRTSWHLRVLAWSLHQIAYQMENSGRYEDALGPGGEAVEMRRELVANNRNINLPFLADSLYNLAVYLSKSGRYNAAVSVVDEAINIRRELVGRSRSIYLPLLADSLHNSAVYLNNLGRYNDAVKAGEEATKIYRELVEPEQDTDQDSALYSLRLDNAINNLAINLEMTGQYEDAIKAREEVRKVDRRQTRTV